MFFSRFKFLDPGPLTDGELSLVPPSLRYLDELLHAEHLSGNDDLDGLRERTENFIANCPRGHQRADRLAGKVPAYHFWMRVDPRYRVPRPPAGSYTGSTTPAGTLPWETPSGGVGAGGSGGSGVGLPVRIAGGIGFRVGSNDELELYSGHVGYHVYPPARGHHFAERAVRLILPLARRHGIDPLWITTNPDNFASRRTCERLGARLVEIVDIPPGHPFRDRGETQKCRYRLDL